MVVGTYVLVLAAGEQACRRIVRLPGAALTDLRSGSSFLEGPKRFWKQKILLR
jgi:hypothetical protein